MDLIDKNGHRKYLTATETEAFLKAASEAERDVRTFCETLAYAGCRLSEALEMTAERIDLTAGELVFRSLKKRDKLVFRRIPVPPAFLDTLDMVHGVRAAQKRPDRGKAAKLWDWSDTTAWRRVCEVMRVAGIEGPHATPKGLRHGFGVQAAGSGVPLDTIQECLGHAQLSTTAIYTKAMGPEKRKLVARMWNKDDD